MPVESNIVSDGFPPVSFEKPHRTLVERYGLDIRHTKRVTSASEIDGADHTLYIVTDTINGGRWFNKINDVAIIGDGGGIKTDNRGYDFMVENGANGFLIANLQIDQTHKNGWFRVNAPGNNVWIDGIRLNGDVSSPPDVRNVEGGPTYYIPATDENATNGIVNVDLGLHGTFPRVHYGNRPTGLWTGRTHKGTIRIIDSLFEGIPNNAIYGTNSPGKFEIIGSIFRDNGVTCGGRIAHGYWKDCHISFDASRDLLEFDAQPNHAAVGMAAEQKKTGVTGEPGPNIINTTVQMKNTGKGGAGIRAYDIYKPAKLGQILRSEVHIEKGTGGYDADIEIEGPVGEVRDMVFSGSNDEYASIVNTSGEKVTLNDCKWSYPAGRKKDKGDSVVWA